MVITKKIIKNAEYSPPTILTTRDCSWQRCVEEISAQRIAWPIISILITLSGNREWDGEVKGANACLPCSCPRTKGVHYLQAKGGYKGWWWWVRNWSSTSELFSFYVRNPIWNASQAFRWRRTSWRMMHPAAKKFNGVFSVPNPQNRHHNIQTSLKNSVLAILSEWWRR